MNEYELYHHGVKGMKWGVRKKRPSNSIVSRKRNKSDDLYDEARKAERSGNLIKSHRLKNEADRRADRERSGMANIDDTIDSVKRAVDKLKNKKQGKSEYRKERDRQNQYLFTKRAVDVGTALANKYLKDHDTTLNGRPLRVTNKAKAVVNTMLNYRYMKNTLK